MGFNVIEGNGFYMPFFRFLKALPEDYIATMAQVQARHGDLVHWRALGGVMNLAFLSDPTVNRELYVRNTDALEKLPSQIQTFLYAAGPSVATAHGEVWRKKRKEANALFSRTAVEAPCAGQVDVIARFVAGMDAAPQDALLLARRMAALTSSRGILGREISVREADTQIAFSQAAARRFNAESAHLFARPNWVMAPWRRELTRRKHEVFAIVRAAIEDLRATDAPNDGLMNHYVNGDFVTSGDAEMQSILVGLLVGAQDNVASGLAWVLAFLAQAPDVQAQIRSGLGAGMHASDLQSCALLKATIAEVLRLRPPAPGNQPRTLNRTVTIAGHDLPKRTLVFNSIFNMHHDPAVFAEPDRFDPTRSLDGALDRSPNYAPFGHGPRNCVAQGMAIQQLMAAVAGLLRGRRLAAQFDRLPEIRQVPFLVPAPFTVSLEKV